MNLNQVDKSRPESVFLNKGDPYSDPSSDCLFVLHVKGRVAGEFRGSRTEGSVRAVITNEPSVFLDLIEKHAVIGARITFYREDGRTHSYRNLI